MPEATTGHVRAVFAWVDNYPYEGFESDMVKFLTNKNS